ncbi:MAG: bifunctional serine/threonine protein kinase/MFS transporter [Ktedonobacteraceae bacterium]
MDGKELISLTLGTCTFERIIGRGGMGAVFLAQQSRPVRTVAVKVLIPSNAVEPDQQRVFLERFRREADTVAKLEHKNILPIYEYDEATVDGQQLAYLVMPYIRGGTLRERIDEMKRSGSQFDLGLVASYISQVADALSYAHSLGVVHRDIKPGNLLFHLDGRLLLSDFGIVRLKAMPALTSVGSFLGTAEYASPEQISTNEIDFRSDIYSLGIILYELLTGTVPYSGPTPFAVMAKKLSEPVPSIRNIRPDLSPAIETVIMKALARNPADRYQTATMLAADFRAAVASSTGSALRLTGDGNNSDLTIPERPWGVPLDATISTPDADSSFPPKQPTSPIPLGVAVWQRSPGQWQWPSQAQAQGQSPVGVLPPGTVGASFPDSEQDKFAPNARTTGPDVQTYRWGRRLFFYGTLLITLLLQFPVFVLLTSKQGTEVIAALGVLLASSINLLVLAAIGFTGVTRNRNIRRFVYRCLIAALIAPVIAGFSVNFGGAARGVYPLIAYVVLLVSNLYALRQLARVDAAREQIEIAPVRWRPAAVGALTGLLPLTIILIFALPALFVHAANNPLLFNMLGVLLVIFIGIPTPGAIMSVRLSENPKFPSLLRSSAMAGILMFVFAFLLLVIWGLIFSPGNLSKTWLVLLITAGVLCVIGALRGMLDAWVYQQIRTRNKGKASP